MKCAPSPNKDRPPRSPPVSSIEIKSDDQHHNPSKKERKLRVSVATVQLDDEYRSIGFDTRLAGALRFPHRMWRRTFLQLAAAATGAGADQASWRVGVAKTDITPREPIWLAGYGSRTHPSEGVRQPIFVKALALQDQTGAKSVMVTSDLLGFPRVVAEPIARECQAKLGLSRERLALNSSHTHSAPVIADMLLPAYPAMTAQQQDVIRRYTEELIVKVVATVTAATANLAPASLAFGQGEAGFGVNRRRVTLRQLPGPVDQDLPVLSVRDAGGRLRAVLFGYACHNTTLGDYQVNGDWAGFAQSQLEQMYPGAVALYAQGCGADINPLPRYQGSDPRLGSYSVELARDYGKIAAVAVDLVLHGKMKSVEGPVRAAYSLVDVPFHDVPTRAELEKQARDDSAGSVPQRRWAQYMLGKMGPEGKLPDRYPYPLQVWQFGRSLKLIVMGGEVVVDYSLRLKSAYGWYDTWVVGYSNDVFAYIPSLRVLREGGYEGGGAMIPYGQPAPFGAAVEEIIIEKIAGLMRQTAG